MLRVFYVVLLTFLSRFSFILTSHSICNTNFTIQCNFEKCLIPGQYCDQSDSDFFRCATCDEDICNGDFPGECKIPCLNYQKDEKEISSEEKPTETYWDTEKGQGFLIVMAISMVINLVAVPTSIILAWIQSGKKELRTMQKDTDTAKEESKIVLSNSKSEIPMPIQDV